MKLLNVLVNKSFLSLVIVFVLSLFCFTAKAHTLIIENDTASFEITVVIKDSLKYTTQLTKKEIRKRKAVSALFAFPFPFGFMGAHRVMLGTKPWVPVVYVATFGGCFGIIPLIDFFVIVFSKDIEQYENNAQLFMWVK